MNVDQYRNWRIKRDDLYNVGHTSYSRMFYAVGLGGEIGEVLNMIKKLMRDKNNHLTTEFRKELISEYGDILWYLLGSMDSFDITIDEIISDNVRKILERE